MTFTRRRVVDAIDIKPDQFVVEVGGGHLPFARADLIFEKYPDDNYHRAQDLVQSSPVVIADALKIPLPDQGCDLLFASHIIEHLSAPDRFLGEARRVARRIYLEFPSFARELMFSWSVHQWVVTAEGTHLTFYRNDIPQLFGDFFHRNYDFLFDAWTLQRHRALNSWLLCDASAVTCEFASESAFERVLTTSATGTAKVNKAPPAPVRYTWSQLGVLAIERLLPGPVLDRAVQARRRRRRAHPALLSGALIARLVCLRCRTRALSRSGDEIVCAGCGARYGQRAGIFDFDV